MAKNIRIIPGDGTLEFFGTGGTAAGNPTTFEGLEDGSVLIKSPLNGGTTVMKYDATTGKVSIGKGDFVDGSGFVLPSFSSVSAVPSGSLTPGML